MIAKHESTILCYLLVATYCANLNKANYKLLSKAGEPCFRAMSGKQIYAIPAELWREDTIRPNFNG